MDNRKYEIANKTTGGIFDEKELDITGLSNAFDIYAEEVALDFFKWYAIKTLGFIQYLKEVKPMVTSNEIEEKLEEFEGKPFKMLFEIYKKEKL